MTALLNRFIAFIFLLVVIFILALGIRGLPGNVSEADLSSPAWTEFGPFELSPERGRFALTYSVIENKSYSFSPYLAQFAAPDVGYKDGKYVSLFAPAISYLIIPGYLLGKSFALSQVGAFAVIALFALVNFQLIRLITKKLGAAPNAANLAALTFLFATPAFAYAVSIYQHHTSTFLVLASLYLLLRKPSVLNTALIWFLCAAAIPIDYPNLFFLFPLGLYSLGRLIAIKISNTNFSINFNFRYLIALIGIVPPLLFFLWFNQVSYGSPTQFSGTVTQVKQIGSDGLPAQTQSTATDSAKLAQAGSEKRSAIRFFNTRATLNGLYELWLSSDRGVITFTPVILLGFFGIYLLYKTGHRFTILMLGVIAGNVALYSMWGDVYGGWAFGSRYLIPTYAILAIGLGLALSKWRKSILFTILFLVLFIYSSGVGILGALTSSANPPKAEILGLEQLTGRAEKYSWDRNWQYLTTQGSKSVVYNSLVSSKLSAESYFQVLFAGVVVLGLIQLVVLRFKKQ